MKSVSPFKTLRLYNFADSSASWRVRLVLNWKKLNYEYISINLRKKDQHKAEYSTINPFKQIPALEIDGKDILTQSLPICRFLEETVPTNPLLPQDSLEKAHILALCEMINSGMQPKVSLSSTQSKVIEMGADRSKWLAEWMNTGYEALEKYLAPTKGKYCFGDTITLGDFFFLPMTEAGIAKFELDIEKYPISKSILESLRQVPGLKDSYPSSQPDFNTPS